ncbi:uncharacterized protein LOC121369072 isoform X2 [Gigantopelta aegis]|uniref:uncharacterized protein LOC121369072 isoform X2 n=1 Tax=Gigantopelta aegis TaxID=1735272 RepID=UPI001B88A9D6|nr:uncharacterized protein LOC121369072 isoform X2 [Gigantopelta aegis]
MNGFTKRVDIITGASPHLISPSLCQLVPTASLLQRMPPKTQRYRPNMDIILLREYMTVQPYKCGTLKSKQDAWEKIVAVVNQFINAGYPCHQVCVTERASRDRVKTLIETFKKGEMNSLKASGTDEEYSERDALLAHVCSILEDEEVNKPDTKADIKETEHTEFVDGEEVRTTLPAAMQIVIGRSAHHETVSCSLEFDGPVSHFSITFENFKQLLLSDIGNLAR